MALNQIEGITEELCKVSKEKTKLLNELESVKSDHGVMTSKLEQAEGRAESEALARAAVEEQVNLRLEDIFRRTIYDLQF